jgi:hypothetical protein
MKHWPKILMVSLLTLVVVVNMAFLYVATQNADEVVESYDLVDR